MVSSSDRKKEQRAAVVNDHLILRIIVDIMIITVIEFKPIQCFPRVAVFLRNPAYLAQVATSTKIATVDSPSCILRRKGADV